MIKKVYVYLFLFVFFSACLPEGDETLILSYVPVEFLDGWRIGIRCKGKDYDAFVFDFQLDNPKNFKAEGIGEDYTGESRYAVFEGTYHPVTDSLVITVSLYSADKAQLFRKDRVGLLWKDYSGNYLPTIMEYVSPDVSRPCESELIIVFTSGEETADLKKKDGKPTQKSLFICAES